MNQLSHSARGGRTLPLVLLLGLVLLLAAGSYLVVRTQTRAPQAGGEGASGALATDVRRAGSSAGKLLLSFLLLLAFLIGSYLIVRVGRRVVHGPVHAGPTRYVDAWGRYRVTEEQIEAATEETDGPDESGDVPEDPEPPG
jgi:hypothetical protein